MSPIWGVVISAGVVVLLQYGTTAYFAGKIVGRIDAMEGRMGRLELNDQEMWKRINDHETRVSKLQGRLKMNGE